MPDDPRARDVRELLVNLDAEEPPTEVERRDAGRPAPRERVEDEVAGFRRGEDASPRKLDG